MEENNTDLLEGLYRLRKDFLIIGLTGRLGSGCSTIADLLTKEKFEDCKFPQPQSGQFDGNEDRKYRIVYNFLKENWQQFTVIRASDIIVSLLLRHEIEDIQTFIVKKYPELSKKVNWIDLKQEFDDLKEKPEVVNLFRTSDELEFSDDAHKIIIESKLIGDFSKKLKESFKDLISSDIGSPFQYFGDNIRKTGDPLLEDGIDVNLTYSYRIADLIKQLIKQLRNKNSKKNELRIIIDSIRNSFEARYFRERYAAFYLFAVNTEDVFRTKRLSTFSKDQILNLDIEYLNDLKTEETFYKQDIKSCIQMSDIYLHNPDDNQSCGDTFKTIKKSLVRYLALIFQPGVITPTAEERTMQVAYTAKYNSGCISRQVGAVVTDKDFSIKSIGWNNTPQGQTPCLLRNAEDLINNTDNISFSEYEKSDSDIKKYVNLAVVNDSKKLKGLNPCFCFKQVQNAIDGEKNQVHTRSLHAEENAMLQISKYGGEGLQEGNLFTTASPCELCSKKAYQLGIKNIHYIDPYPGIAAKQILHIGEKVPVLHLFSGAVGKAYHCIFEPFMPYKDEIEIKLGVNYKQLREAVNRDKPPKFKEKRANVLKKIIAIAQAEIDALGGS